MKKISVVLAALALGMFFQVHAAAAQSIALTVDGLVCAFCAQGIDKKLRALDATADVHVSLEHRLVALELKPGQDVSDAALVELLKEAGYTVRAVKRVDAPLATLRAAPQS